MNQLAPTPATGAPIVTEICNCIDPKYERSISVDSSYDSGEDEEHHNNLARQVRNACLSRTSRDYRKSRHALQHHDPGRLPYSQMNTNVAAARLLLSAMQDGTQAVAPVDITIAKSKALDLEASFTNTYGRASVRRGPNEVELELKDDMAQAMPHLPASRISLGQGQTPTILKRGRAYSL